jgi:Protein of unknown function (DUF4240)
MTLDQFWEHIDATRDPDSLVERLAELPPDEILDFEYFWHTTSAQAYRWNLWGAAYLINGGCSDDGFIDFRSWLMLQGRKVFDAALANPDSLADVVDGDEAECECYPGSTAWFQATGTKRDTAGLTAQRTAYEARHPSTPAPRDEDMGENWDFDDEEQMRRRLPRLTAMYLDND